MQEQILSYLQTHPAKQLLWLAEDPEHPKLEGCEVRCLTPQAAHTEHDAAATFDCAVVQDLPGALSKPEAEALIAHLRDVLAHRILWLIDSESAWERQDLLALGFRKLDETEDGSHLYGYDIDNYKQTPDWLNAKNWANPDQWGKKRW